MQVQYGQKMQNKIYYVVNYNCNYLNDFITWDGGRCHSPHLEPKIRTPGHFGL